MLKVNAQKVGWLMALFSCTYAGSVLANQQVSAQADSVQTVVDTTTTVVQEVEPLATQQIALENQLTEEQLAAEQKAEEARLAAEKQAQAELMLKNHLGDISLQFYSAVAKIYADKQFQPLWTNKAVEAQFLHEYAAMVASGISKNTFQALAKIDEAEEGSLRRDVLLTDAFLDYLYYTKNVSKSAQKWLYSSNNYKAQQPAEEQIAAWLTTLEQDNGSAFLTALSTQNTLYKQTLKALSASVAEHSDKAALSKMYKLAINAQRLRVIPAFKDGLFVNIPSYKLDYYRDGQLILSSKVIVGKKSRKTPVMYSKLSNVVVNPPWNAPVRLINEDIIPKVRKDPSYIYRNGYTIIDGKGRTIDPYTIDWENMTAKKFPYRLRQAPGDSALGNFKFNMPSSDAIYLHDTPNRGLFGKSDRALSSGCVRVEKSDQLATILLKEAGWSEEKKRSVLQSRKTTSATVSSHNPVFLYYVTMWVNNGQTHTLPDIYGYDVTPNLSYINWNIVKKYLN
ncbi:L,D-transpeptidase family protein [Pasteurella sp. PK-2025]|uniref:L,D-transpeptidase family protein n=1 Tax=unclassified Pasteurella TaxID=2621516 RepID=UPI003C7926F7